MRILGVSKYNTMVDGVTERGDGVVGLALSKLIFDGCQCQGGKFQFRMAALGDIGWKEEDIISRIDIGVDSAEEGFELRRVFESYAMRRSLQLTTVFVTGCYSCPTHQVGT